MKLREIEILCNQGNAIAEAARRTPKEERRCTQKPSLMPPVDIVEKYKALGAIVGSIASSIGLYATVKALIKKWREKHPIFRRSVLDNLKLPREG